MATDPLMLLLKDVKSDVESTKSIVDSMNRELGGIQSTLSSIEKHNVERDKKLDSVHREQLGCLARSGYGAVNARLDRIDRHLDETRENTGAFSLPFQTTAMHQQVKKDDSVPLKDAFIKMLPFLIMAFAVGAGALAILAFKFFVGGK